MRVVSKNASPGSCSRQRVKRAWRDRQLWSSAHSHARAHARASDSARQSAPPLLIPSNSACRCVQLDVWHTPAAMPAALIARTVLRAQASLRTRAVRTLATAASPPPPKKAWLLTYKCKRFRELGVINLARRLAFSRLGARRRSRHPGAARAPPRRTPRWGTQAGGGWKATHRGCLPGPYGRRGVHFHAEGNAR